MVSMAQEDPNSTQFRLPSGIWFTGLSGAGKTTLSQAVAQFLKKLKFNVELWDGDEIRRQNAPRGFSKSSRLEHNKMIINQVTEKLAQSKGIGIVATISPFEEIRRYARKMIPNYFEVFVSTPLKICQQRDPKGLYKLVDEGKIKNFTGIHQNYEVPCNPDLILQTDQMTIDECKAILTEKYLKFLSQEINHV